MDNEEQQITNIKYILAESSDEERDKIVEWLIICCINYGVGIENIKKFNLDELIKTFLENK